MKYSIPGLGGRLRRARQETGMSQDVIAKKIGVSLMTVARWERSERGVPDHLLEWLCGIYHKPLSWFLTLEDGDLDEVAMADRAYPITADRILRKLADTPPELRPMIQKAVEDLIDDLRRVG